MFLPVPLYSHECYCAGQRVRPREWGQDARAGNAAPAARDQVPIDPSANQCNYVVPTEMEVHILSFRLRLLHFIEDRLKTLVPRELGRAFYMGFPYSV